MLFLYVILIYFSVFVAEVALDHVATIHVVNMLGGQEWSGGLLHGGDLLYRKLL